CVRGTSGGPWSGRSRGAGATPARRARWLDALGHVGEERVVLVPDEPDRARRTVAVLGNVDLGQRTVLRLCVVDLVAVDEHDDVGVLFEGARLAQVGQQRPLVGALLEPA